MWGRLVFARVWIAFSILILLALHISPAQSVANSNYTVAEGKDFATNVLGDPWDMKEYSDLSQYINRSGQELNLENLNLDSVNGIFSATTLTSDAWFFPLFPGYETAVLIGKIGENYPIVSSDYHCLYMAAKIDSPANTPQAPALDVMRVFSFDDEKLGGLNDRSKMSLSQIVLDKETPWAPPQIWKIYKIDLVNDYVSAAPPFARWNEKTLWKGFRINPTIYANINFAVDWVRLTDCNARTIMLNQLSVGITYSFSLVTPDGREILVDKFSAAGSSASVDLQGVAPGTYPYRLKAGNVQVATGMVTVDAAPIVSFTKPSTTSGVDYAASMGNSWDFNDSSDFHPVYGTHDLVNPAFSNGIFSFSVPSNTPGTNTIDSIIYLNTPQIIPTANRFRYLTVRLYTEGMWQNVPQGMMARWVWTVPVGPVPQACWLVGQDIPYDIGWNTLTLDLSQDFTGSVEETAGDYCAGIPRHWRDTFNVDMLRFDPSEYELPGYSNQAVDYIMLTAVDQVKQGALFPVIFNISEPKTGVQMTYYYTTSRAQPTQNLATMKTKGGGSPSQGPWRLFLPAITNVIIPGPQSDISWDTTGVAIGEYYLCVVSNDGLNTTTFCSDAPVQVIP